MANIQETFLRDITHKSDLLRTPTGDLETIDGIENVKNALFRRLVTEPGSLVHRPDYGVGLKQFQNSPSSLGTQRVLAQRINEQFLLDPRVESVLGVSVDFNDYRPENVKILVRIKLVGYEETSMNFIPFGEGV